ncbi:MAG: arsenical resistance operon transcriptional repressor ArsD [Bacteroidetes bacterium]|nr:MAG: arsenical resistance operon transcriptional repressor ArsD [Bacteroidota bacterium]
MKKIEIFDPALCCPTGLCGPNINPDLMRIAAAIEALKRKGVDIVRHNLRDVPQVYVDNTIVNIFLQENGADALPVTLVDNKLEVAKGYPTNQQLTEWTGVDLDFIPRLQ